MDGSLKNGTNTVCNLVDYAIINELKLEYRDKICLYSDAAGGQNRNYLMLQYSPTVSVKFQIEIQHLFLVIGHSYCQCVSNFGLYGNKKRIREKIETEKAYVELTRTPRTPLFKMVNAAICEVKDYESVFIPDEGLNKIKISKVVKIVYFPNGQVDLYYSYTGSPTSIKIGKAVLIDLSNALAAGVTGIAKEKETDYKNLLQYCTSSGQNFGNKFLKKTSIKSVVIIKGNVKGKTVGDQTKKTKKSKHDKKVSKKRKN